MRRAGNSGKSLTKKRCRAFGIRHSLFGTRHLRAPGCAAGMQPNPYGSTCLTFLESIADTSTWRAVVTAVTSKGCGPTIEASAETAHRHWPGCGHQMSPPLQGSRPSHNDMTACAAAVFARCCGHGVAGHPGVALALALLMRRCIRSCGATCCRAGPDCRDCAPLAE